MTYGVTDSGENAADTLTRTVLVEDHTIPALGCPDDVIVGTDPDERYSPLGSLLLPHTAEDTVAIPPQNSPMMLSYSHSPSTQQAHGNGRLGLGT